VLVGVMRLGRQDLMHFLRECKYYIDICLEGSVMDVAQPASQVMGQLCVVDIDSEIQ
jgi:hypothetical protein